MSSNIKRYLVTGGAGFIGSHVVKLLLDNGYNVTVFDDLSSGCEDNIDKRARVLVGDLRDTSAVRKAVQDVSGIFHLAAFVNLQESNVNSDQCMDVNVTGTSVVISEAKRAGVDKIVFSSSSAVYDMNERGPLKENCSIKPDSPYALSKYFGEMLMRSAWEKWHLKTICLRYFNVFGPKQNVDSDYAAVIPSFIVKIIKGERVNIYGSGEQTRDFISVNDVANANLVAMKSNIEHDIFNVGSGKELSVNQLYSIIRRVTRVDLDPRHECPLPGDAMFSLADTLHIKEKLMWTPKHDFEVEIDRTVEWFKKSCLSAY